MTRLLVIDDEPLILDSFEMAFPYDEVTICVNAHQGIDAFLESSFRLGSTM
ncbi:hypothetical protein [Novipirellula artificiosorum]|uniref:Response regulatory domain-containing protein n=1 Tax=Novipirellula artificiosorum TaxID=2528016 RepID=A0A5C6D766_9BACT|nr:hypothetical protein [Novipirellula artificiosorum]TWU30729.1 hypothetical protein Poly41_66340 [Novipirellula artificiosorum]